VVAAVRPAAGLAVVDAPDAPSVPGAPDAAGAPVTDAPIDGVVSENSGSEEESPEEDLSPIAARIASSQAWAASTVGEVWAAVVVAEPGTAA
jgi:hypothetical protein